MGGGGLHNKKQRQDAFVAQSARTFSIDAVRHEDAVNQKQIRQKQAVSRPKKCIKASVLDPHNFIKTGAKILRQCGAGIKNVQIFATDNLSYCTPTCGII
jgi:hypothetical protein